MERPQLSPISQMLNPTPPAGRVACCMDNWTVNIRPLDSTGGTGVSHRVDQAPLSDLPYHHLSEIKGGIHASGGRSPEFASERGSGSGRPVSGPVYKQAVSGNKKRWIFPTSGEPETSKPLCPEMPLQDGGVGNDQGFVAGGGLDVLPGPTGCIPVSVSYSITQEVSAFHVGQQDVRVYLPPIWTLQCPLHLYKAPSTSHGAPVDARATVHNRDSPNPIVNIKCGLVVCSPLASCYS